MSDEADRILDMYQGRLDGFEAKLDRVLETAAIMQSLHAPSASHNHTSQNCPLAEKVTLHERTLQQVSGGVATLKILVVLLTIASTTVGLIGAVAVLVK